MSDDGSGGSGGGSSGNGSLGDGPDPALGGLLSRLARLTGPDGLELGGDSVRLEQAPEDGLEVRITLLGDDGEVTSVASMLLPSDARPPAHPDGVPFVRRASLRVIEDYVRGVILAMWMLDETEQPDPEAVLAAVIRQSREAGWRLEAGGRLETGWQLETGGEPDPEAGSAAVGEGSVTGPFRLLRGDEVRRVELRVSATGPTVSLTQRRNVKDAGLQDS